MSVQTIIPGTDLISQAFGPSVLDAPDPDDCVEFVRETFCLACQAPVARFESHGGDMLHYVGDPMNASGEELFTASRPFPVSFTPAELVATGLA